MNVISAVILTRNEEKNLNRCLRTLDFCDELIVVDDFSTDGTIKVAKSYNAKVFQKELKGDFAGQRNFGQSKATGEWLLFIDADEAVTEDLKKEIREAVGSGFDGFYLRRRDFFWGRQLKYGEVRHVRNNGLLRLVKKDSGTWLGNVHEVFHTARRCGRLNGFLNHYPHQTLTEFISDINTYSSLRAKELLNTGKSTNIADIMFTPALKFAYNYFFNFGFLDGPAGFAYAFMMSFHSFLVRSKLYQYKNIKTQ